VLIDKSFNAKRNLSPQNHSKQKETSHLKIIQNKKKPLTSKSFNTKETSHLKIIQYKKKPLTSKSFNTKRNLSPQNQSTQKETSHLRMTEVRGFFLC
jgi:hypothetical protein